MSPPTFDIPKRPELHLTSSKDIPSAQMGRDDDVGFLSPKWFLMRAFGITLMWDLHERTTDLRLKLPIGKKRIARIENIRRGGAIFIHVPKNAGTSVSDALYGRSMRHETIGYYQHTAPDLYRSLPSFAIWRDPVERFLSAYDFARKGGGRHVAVHPTFAARYRKFRSLDDAIDHVENTTRVYDLDHVFRPQHWYVTDRQGNLAVDTLIHIDDLTKIGQVVAPLAGQEIPFLNETIRSKHSLRDDQVQRIRTIYARDVELMNYLHRF